MWGQWLVLPRHIFTCTAGSTVSPWGLSRRCAAVGSPLYLLPPCKDLREVPWLVLKSKPASFLASPQYCDKSGN